MIFYLAGQYNRREELCGYRADLEARGYSVPARWLLGEHQVHGVEAARLVQAGGPVPVEEARPFAEDDIEDIEACDVFVAFTAPPPQSGRGGRHFESGYAYALRPTTGQPPPRLVIVGPAENIFHSLPEWERYATWADFLDGPMPSEHTEQGAPPKHRPDQPCDCINPKTGRRHHGLPGDPPYHCAAAWEIQQLDPRGYEYPSCTSHPTAERTHWNGTTWVEPPVSPESLWLQAEPPDGEAMEPRIREFPSGARRDSDADATRYDLISPQAMERLAATYAEGAIKYSDHNFRKGIPYSVMANHALRHIYRWLAGEDGEDHLAHAAWGIFGLIEFEETRPELDDRFRWECKP